MLYIINQHNTGFAEFVLQELGFRLTKQTVGIVVQRHVPVSDHPSPFHDGQPGRDWWQGFLK